MGVIEALRAYGWQVHAFIVGDRVSRKWTSAGSAETLHHSLIVRLAADVTRLALGWLNSRRAWHAFGGQVDWVYERFGIFQALGRRFQRGGVPWILEANGPFFYEASHQRKSIAMGWLARRLELAAYRQCDALVCVTEALKETLLRECSVAPEKIVVVPNGVDTAFFDPARYESQRPLDGLVLGFVGSLVEWQGLDLLLDVLAELRAERFDLSLVIVGEGPAREALEAQTRALGLTSQVRFVGSVPSEMVPSHISGVDIGFSGQVASRMGMYHSPLKLYEYMAMAKPVIASAFADARAVVRDGETGFLFEAGNGPALKRALRRAYEARAQFPLMGGRARALMVAEHTWLARVRFMIPEIERVLQSRR
jgi:glycosyltransferase involved in cell wall biosynthesis